jgi:hypothetical protein
LRFEVFNLCKRIAGYPIAVGMRDTPTPRGTFFLNSLLKPPDHNSVYGVLAFGLSAYSNVIRDWTWGGVVGIHGTNDPSSIGHRVSHGCIRLQNAAIRKLARLLPLGTLVKIHWPGVRRLKPKPPQGRERRPRQDPTSIRVDEGFASTYIDDVNEATKIATQASSSDPKVGLRGVAALRRLVEQLEALQVRNARNLGWSWQSIARELTVSKQAVHKKHAGRRFRPGR